MLLKRARHSTRFRPASDHIDLDLTTYYTLTNRCGPIGQRDKPHRRHYALATDEQTKRHEDITIALSPALEFRGNYSATSNSIKLVHWPLMGGLLHLVQRGGDWAGPQPAHASLRCTKCNSPPINGQCTNHRIAV